MIKVVLLLMLVVCGCSKNNAENKANFEACVHRAEQRYQEAFSEICIHKPWNKAGECNYNVATRESMMRSKDNEITACATMFAPAK